MSRSKGPGTIKFLDATKQDGVAMRRALWRGGEFASLQGELTDLYTAQSKLIQERSDLGVRALPLLELLKGQPTTLSEIKKEREARAELGSIEIEFKRVEMALVSTEKQIEERQKQIDKMPRPRRERAVLGWHEEATRIIELAYLSGDTPKGLAEYEREIALASANPNRERIEQRKSEQAAMTPVQRAERIRKRDAPLEGYEQYLSTRQGHVEWENWMRRFWMKAWPAYSPSNFLNTARRTVRCIGSIPQHSLRYRAFVLCTRTP